MTDALDDVLARLVPRPRGVEPTGVGSWRPAKGYTLVDRCGDARPAALLRRGLDALGIAVRAPGAGVPSLALGVDRSSAPAQGYRLELDAGGARLTGGDAEGLANAARTLLQLLRLGVEVEEPLPALAIDDAPDFLERGVQLDVSRDRVPTMEHLFALVDRLASWKVNRLQLYTEHAFAYPGHEVVWKDASPIEPGEARALDRFCAERFVELVPNQQSFGHLHRWLRHEPYRALAEVPEGIEHPFSPEREPYGLCPLDPGSLDFLAGLYDALLPCFASRALNVGFDETVDLGLGRSKGRCDEVGTSRVYLDFLLAVRRLAAERGRDVQVFADVLLKEPTLLAELPADVTLLVWGYEADHPFDAELAAARARGHAVHVCPGTSSWNSLGGRTRNMTLNLKEAARAGREHGARGYLVTDWGDRGHLQPPAISEPGFLLGAALAWNADDDGGRLAERLDAHVLRDPTGLAGEGLLDLGRACDVAGSRIHNGSALFFLLERAAEELPHARVEGATRASLDDASGFLVELASRFGSSRPAGTDGDGGTIRAELLWTAETLALAADLGRARLASSPPSRTASLPPGTRSELAERLRRLLAGHRELWLARSRPGGLPDSAARLERPLRELSGLSGS